MCLELGLVPHDRLYRLGESAGHLIDFDLEVLRTLLKDEQYLWPVPTPYSYFERGAKSFLTLGRLCKRVGRRFLGGSEA